MDNNQNSFEEESKEQNQQWSGPGDPYNNSYPYNNYNRPREYGNGLGIASMVCGIISIVGLCACLGPLMGILAIVFGAIQLNRTKRSKELSIAGIITGAIGILLSLIIAILITINVKIISNTPNMNEIYDDIYNEIYDDLYQDIDL